MHKLQQSIQNKQMKTQQGGKMHTMHARKKTVHQRKIKLQKQMSAACTTEATHKLVDQSAKDATLNHLRPHW